MSKVLYIPKAGGMTVYEIYNNILELEKVLLNKNEKQFDK